jgi:uncharacterized protein with NRDE domain
MCVAALAWDCHPEWLLVAIGNRDEFHARPTAPLAVWADGSGVIAGKDLLGGGTWLGVSESGRFALVTNYRVPEGPKPGRPTRGKLVTDLLQGFEPEGTAAMNPFNVIQAGPSEARFLTNYPTPESRPLAAGIHGLSNGGFDVPWPKTLRLQAALDTWLASPDGDTAPLMHALRSEAAAPDEANRVEGPEPRFAPIFIRNETYGTRSSTVVMISRQGHGVIRERSFSPDGSLIGEVQVDFRWP